jgi:flagella basal body P-ring formation protein FlgA
MPRSLSRFAFFVFAFSAHVVQAAVPCFAPSGDWITGDDLASAVPALAALPPALKVGYAPVPGLERVFHPDELRRLALANGLPDPKLTANVCSAWPLAPLTSEKLVAAMQKALAGREPQIELLARNLAPAPAGEVVFPLAGLSGYSENAVIWKGYVIYAGTRRFETWASVRVRIKEIHLKAQGAIHVGDRLAPGQWRAETYAGPPSRDEILSDGANVEGLVARRDFVDGALLLTGYFEMPKAVERGDTVVVLAGAGAARIEAPGVALTAGRCGDVIGIRNPRSNRTFRARISAAGLVEVLPGTSAGLAGNDAKGNPL